MIKYADRGLVEKGTTRKLFYHLFNLCSVIWFLLFSGNMDYFMWIYHWAKLVTFSTYAGVSFSLYITKGWEAEKYMKNLNRCKAVYEDFNQGSKVYGIQMSSFLIIFPAVIMVVGIKYFVAKRSKSSQIPAKFGRYQRNLLTYYQIVQYLVTFIILQFVLASLLKGLEENAISG